MDVLQEPSFTEPKQSRAAENESHDHGSTESHDLKTCDPIGPAALALHTVNLSSRMAEVPALSSPFSTADIPDESTANATSLSSLSSFSSLSSLSSLSSVSCSKPVTPWSVPQSCADRPPLSAMESPSGGDSCLSCLIQTKSPAEPESCESVLGLTSEYQPCPATATIGMQCLGSVVPPGHYGDQVLSDQLLSAAPARLAGATEGADAAGRAAQDSESDEDVASRSIYEGLGEEGQDWSCLESLISESRMELLDLCARSELAVNLFCEEDVENYMFQEEDAALSADVCSLKIRYEAYQDGAALAHERSEPAPQDDAQLAFFPSVACARREGPRERPGQWGEEKADAQATPDVSPDGHFLFDFSNSPGDSGEFSDDDSSCAGSSPDAWLARRRQGRLSRENSTSSSQLSYRLRAKRKVAYRDDYLYDVDSIDSERNAEKREKLPAGPKEEPDDDWCPKKRRKPCRKEPPVVIKYIIVNRFKGEKNMRVKLGRVDPSAAAVRLSSDALLRYERLAPLKAYWQRKEREQQEQRRLAAGDRTRQRLNGCKRPPSSLPRKRKRRMASRVRIQRIHAVEKLPSSQSAASSDCPQEVSEQNLTITDVAPTSAATDCPARLGSGDTTYVGRAKSRTQEREERRKGSKTGKIKKFKSEARLKSKKLKDTQREDSAAMSELTEASPVIQHQHIFSTGNPDPNESATTNAPERCTLTPACSGPSGNVALLPGGYLQTLLEASDSSSSAGVTFFSPQQQSGSLPLRISLQPSQSCVLSPPSESELPQSPHAHTHHTETQHTHHTEPNHTLYAETNHNEPNYPVAWHSQPPADQLPFSPEVPSQSPMMPSGFPRSVLAAADGSAVSEYGLVLLAGCQVPYEELTLEPPPLDAEYRLSPVGSRGDGAAGRLVSFNSLGSLSAASSSYSSLSLRDGERDAERDGGEEEMGEMNDSFLSHCSPRLVLQQSLDVVTPLRESADLLDISNFTPDKFRHSSLSEMSPPDTPSSSPQLLGSCGKGPGFPEAGGVCGATELQWDCGGVPQLERDGAGNAHLLQIHTFRQDEEESEGRGLEEEEAGLLGLKGSKRRGGKNGQGSKKSKTPRGAKSERGKPPRQGSRSARKIKALLEGKAARGGGRGGARSQSGTASPTPSLSMLGGLGEWPAAGGLSDDDQREFQEPSNILSNIVSGMAEVQRFMQASMEPLWPCSSPGQHTLQSQTLRILGSPAELRKRGAASGRGRKGAGRGGKATTKLLPPAFFPPLGLDCIPVPLRPAHKKMYRHKSSTKFARDELLAGKRDIKSVALTAEKRRAAWR